MEFFVPLAQELTEFHYRLWVLFLHQILDNAASALPPLLDIDVAEAAGAVASTLETARKGIIYEHQPTSLPAQRLATQLRRTIGELTPDGAAVARLERDAATALRCHERGARSAESALRGDSAPVYLSFLSRMEGRVSEPADGDSVAEAQDAQAGRLIIPG